MMAGEVRVLMELLSSDTRIGAVNDALDLAELAAPHGVRFTFCGQVEGTLRSLAGERGIGVVPGRSRMFSRRSLPLHAASALKWVTRLRRLRPDIIHLNYSGYGPSLALAARLCRIPLVARAGWGFHAENPANRWIDAYVANCRPHAQAMLDSPLADRVVVTGDLFRRERLEKPTPPIRPLPPRIPGRTRFLFLGQLVPRKGITDLVEAFALAGMEADLLLVGGDWSEDGYPRQVRKLVGRLGLGGRIHLENHRPDAAALLEDCDVFVLPSLSEARPRSIIEAMCLGRPVIATAVGGIPTLVDEGRTGLLIPAEDPAALAAALRQLAASSELRRRLGEAGRLRAESEFSPEQTARRYVELYQSLTRSSTAPRAGLAMSCLSDGVS